MLSLRTDRFRPFVWFTVVMFTLSSIPHLNMALRCIPTPFSSTAYAAESPSRSTDTHTEAAQGQTPYKPPPASDKPKDPEKPGKDKDPDGKSGGGEIMTMSSAGGADSAAGISLPGLDALLFTGAATVKIPIEVPREGRALRPTLPSCTTATGGTGLSEWDGTSIWGPFRGPQSGG